MILEVFSNLNDSTILFLLNGIAQALLWGSYSESAFVLSGLVYPPKK